MERQLEEIRDQQKKTWNKFSAGWKKWDDLTMDFLKPMGDEIIKLIAPQNKEIILDVAAGTGEPGLTIATMIGDGHVVITDLAEDMLTIAEESAKRHGIKNIRTIACDVSALPFADNYFDAISCRFGFMFFPDMQMAAKEMVRVLKPGGRIATSVWNIPEKNFWITAMMGTINKHVEVAPPPPGSPGIFRCASEGLIAGIFQEAGLKNVSQKEVISKLNSQTPEVYWDMMTEVAAPVVKALGQADATQREQIRTEVLESIRTKYPEGPVMVDASALVIYGEK